MELIVVGIQVIYFVEKTELTKLQKIQLLSWIYSEKIIFIFKNLR